MTTSDAEAYQNAVQQFEALYGRAMLNWAAIEDHLCRWFFTTAGLSEPMGRAIFFSARNFTARADMLRAATGQSTLGEDRLGLIRKLYSVSRRYSATRNNLTHRIPIVDASSSDWHVLELHEGAKAYALATSSAIRSPSIQNIIINFQELASIALYSWADHCLEIQGDLKNPIPIPEYLERLDRLPKEADQPPPPQSD